MPSARSALGAPVRPEQPPGCALPVQPNRVPVAICSGGKPSRRAERGEREPMGRWLLSDAEVPSKEAGLASRNKRTVGAVPDQRPKGKVLSSLRLG